MKRIAILLFLTFLLGTGATAEVRYIDAATDGQWHYEQIASGETVRFRFKLDKPQYLTATITAPEGSTGGVYSSRSSMDFFGFPTAFSDISGAYSMMSTGGYLNPGEYYAHTYCPPDCEGGRVGVKLNVMTLEEVNEVEPNDVYYNAMPFNLQDEITGVIAHGGDRDMFVAQIAEAGVYTLTIEGSMSDIDVIVYDQYLLPIAVEKVPLADYLIPIGRYSLTLPLEAGSCYVYFPNDYGYNKGDEYSFTLTQAVECRSIKLPKSLTVTSGTGKRLDAVISPASATGTNLVWKSSNYSVATVNRVGLVTAFKKGAATITAETQDGKLKAKCKVKVLDNAFYRSKPLVGKGKAVYASVKRLRYEKDGSLFAQIYLVNRTGQALTNAGDFFAEILYTSGDGTVRPVYRKTFSGFDDGFSLKNGARKVLSLVVSAKELFPDTKFDLPNGQCTAVAGGWLYGKRNASRYGVKNLGQEAKK